MKKISFVPRNGKYGVYTITIPPSIIKYVFENEQFTELFVNIVRKEYLPQELKELYEKIKVFYNFNNTTPPLEFIDNYIEDKKYAKRIKEAITENFTFPYAESILKEIMEKLAVKIAVDVLNMNKNISFSYFKATYEKIKEYIDKRIYGQQDMPIYDIYDLDFEEEDKKIPTGYEELDKYLYGGLPIKGLGIIMGVTGGGKSNLMLNIAANLFKKGLNILYLNMEGGRKYLQKRLFSILTGIEMIKIENIIKDLKTKNNFFTAKIYDNTDKDIFLTKIKELKEMKNKFKIIDKPSYDYTVQEFSAYIKNMVKYKQEKIDIIFVDYDELFANTRGRIDNYRFAFKEIYQELLNISTSLSIPIWVGSQTNRKAVNKDVVDMDVASEDFSKQYGASVVLILGKKNYNIDNTSIKINLAKVRDGIAKKQIMLYYVEGTVKLIEQNSGLEDI